MSAEYDPKEEGVLSWRDAQTAIVWPLDGAPILSAKDAAA